MMGTHGYIAPEFYLNTGGIDDSVMSVKIDVWALGCIIHQILTNNHPFLNKDCKTMEDLKHNVINAKYTLHKSL